MPSTFTTTLQLEKQAFNENSNTWGQRDNTTFDKIDQAINGILVKDLTGLQTPYSLSFLQGSVDETGNAKISFIGNTLGDFIVVLPATARKMFVANNTTSNHNVILECLSGSNTYKLPPGMTALITADGSQILDSINYISGSLNVGGAVAATSLTSQQGALPLTSGGTGATNVNDAYANLTPSGVIHLFAGASPPNGWLLCNGSAVSRTIFASLFATIGSTYGGGDGATTFNIPDLRGRTVFGAGQGNGLSNRQIGQSAGEEAHTQQVSELPSHTHPVSITDPGHFHNFTGTTGVESATHTHTYQQTNQSGAFFPVGSGNAFNPTNVQSTGSESATHTHTVSGSTGVINTFVTATATGTGGGVPFNVMPPFVVMNYIIKT